MEKRSVLVINPVGGLANRMRTLAGGIALAKAIGVDFRVIWLKNWELNAAFEDIFRSDREMSSKFSYPGMLEYGILYSIPRLKNLYLTSCTLKRFGVAFADGLETSRRFTEDDEDGTGLRRMFEDGFSRGKDCFLQGGTNVYPYDKEMYRSIFQPASEIAEVVATRVSRCGEHVVGVHIRRTDNLQSIKNSPDEVFIREMERMLSVRPETGFYLATDSDEVKARFGREFGDKVYCSRQTAVRDTLEGIKEAAIEMFTLAGTEEIIGSYFSSFSEAAAMLGNIPLRQLRVR